jgi:hypothetical protein
MAEPQCQPVAFIALPHLGGAALELVGPHYTF